MRMSIELYYCRRDQVGSRVLPLLKSQGLTWDGIPVPRVSENDLKQSAIELFKEKAVKNRRLTEEDVAVDDHVLLENLHLFDENRNLIRAGVMAFHMRDNPRISARQLAEIVGIAPRNIQVHIKSLKERGLIIREGSAFGGHWVVISS